MNGVNDIDNFAEAGDVLIGDKGENPTKRKGIYLKKKTKLIK